MDRQLIRLLLFAAGLLLASSAAFAEDPPQLCELPASEVTPNVVIATLKCRLEILSQERAHEADRATLASAEAAMLRARLARADGELMELRSELDRARKKKPGDK